MPRYSFLLTLSALLVSPSLVMGDVVTVTITGVSVVGAEHQMRFTEVGDAANLGSFAIETTGILVNDTATDVRNALVLEQGKRGNIGDPTVNVDKIWLRRVTLAGGVVAIEARSVRAIQVWIETANNIFADIEPGGAAVIVDGITYKGFLPDTGNPGGGQAVPAVSTWGLVVMVVLLLTTGTVILGRRRQTAVA